MGAPQRHEGQRWDSAKAPVKPAWEEVVRVHYVEGIASHYGPESCVGYPQGGGEALARGCVGEVSSSEINSLVRRPCANKGKTTRCVALGEVRTGPRSQRPLACAEAPCAGTGRAGKRLCGSHTQSGRRRSVTERPARTLPEQSDRSIVPEKQANKGRQPETAHDRRRLWREGTLTEGNWFESCMYRTQGRRQRYGEP